MDPMFNKACVIIGDRRAGKTSFINKIHSETFTGQYKPTVNNDSMKYVSVGGTRYKMLIHERSFDESLESIYRFWLTVRPGDILLFCIDVTSEKALNNLFHIWNPQRQDRFVKNPWVLIGTKTDLRKEQSGRQIYDYAEGKSVARYVDAVQYFECSAKNDRHYEVFRLFEKAVEAAMSASKK